VVMDTVMTGRRWVAKQLRKAGLDEDTAQWESRILVEKAMGFTKNQYLPTTTTMTQEQQDTLIQLTSRRCDGEPLQYLCGEWEFFGISFSVGEGVLIPRQDTETLVEAVLRLRRGQNSTALLDLCSGSGCIPIAIAKHLPAVQGDCVELSADAFGYLRQNLERYDVPITPWQSDVFTPPETLFQRRYDVITCNPPYLTAADMQNLQREVQFEPAMALDGGTDGLAFYRRLIPQWKTCLKVGGWLVTEVGQGQAAQVAAIMKQADLRQCHTETDLCGVERVVLGQLA